MKHTRWFPAATRPMREGWYEIDNPEIERLHWDGRTWGLWIKPNVRVNMELPSHIQWRGVTESPDV